jgi:hypothetical protein
MNDSLHTEIFFYLKAIIGIQAVHNTLKDSQLSQSSLMDVSTLYTLRLKVSFSDSSGTIGAINVEQTEPSYFESLAKQTNHSSIKF